MARTNIDRIKYYTRNYEICFWLSNCSLSALTAAQVKENNPNFSDLSDPNRPEKLGEQMSLLYDDQWTDATEALADLKLDDDAVVKMLLDILIVRYIVI